MGQDVIDKDETIMREGLDTSKTDQIEIQNDRNYGQGNSDES